MNFSYMHKEVSRLSLSAFIIFILSIVVQSILASGFGLEQIADAKTYLTLANEHIAINKCYPTNVFCSYIFAPGLVNFQIVILKLFKSVTALLFCNIGFFAIIAIEMYYIAKRLFNTTVANISLILFSLYPCNYGMVLITGSELLFMALLFGVILLLFSKKYKYFILAGILAGLANWIRPFLPVIVLTGGFICWKVVEHNMRLKSFLIFCCSIVVAVLVIGTITYIKIGYFNYQSTTGGVNMIMGANDDADGRFSLVAFKKGNIGYIDKVEEKTFIQRDSIWMSRSVEWIKSNPVKWLSLMPKKLFSFLYMDGYAIPTLVGNNKLELTKHEMLSTFPNWGVQYWISFLSAIYYFVILGLSFLSVFFVFKLKNWGVYSLLLFLGLYIGVVLVMVGVSRYHYPIMPIIFIFASWCVFQLSSKCNKRLLSLLKFKF